MSVDSIREVINYLTYGKITPEAIDRLLKSFEAVDSHMESVGFPASKFFEEEYKDNFTLDKSIELGLRSLHSATEGGLNAPAIEIATVIEEKSFEKMEQEKVLKYVETVLKKK